MSIVKIVEMLFIMEAGELTSPSGPAPHNWRHCVRRP
jgi:hypothetical protein